MTRVLTRDVDLHLVVNEKTTLPESVLLGVGPNLFHHQPVVVHFLHTSPRGNVGAGRDLVVLLVAELDPSGCALRRSSPVAERVGVRWRGGEEAGSQG